MVGQVVRVTPGAWGGGLGGTTTCMASCILGTSSSQVSHTALKLQELILNSDPLPKKFTFVVLC